MQSEMWMLADLQLDTLVLNRAFCETCAKVTHNLLNIVFEPRHKRQDTKDRGKRLRQRQMLTCLEARQDGANGHGSNAHACTAAQLKVCDQVKAHATVSEGNATHLEAVQQQAALRQQYFSRHLSDFLRNA